MPLSSTLTTSRCSRARSTIAGSTGLTHRGSTTVTPMPCATSRSATSTDVAAIDPTPTISTSLWPLRTSTSQPPARSTGSRSPLGGPFGNRTTVGRVLDLHRLAQQLAQPGGVAGRGEPQPRHHLEDRHVPHAVVRGAVVAGHPGAVQHERDPAPVQRDVHQHLVEGAVEEGGVDRHHRVQPAHRQARPPTSWRAARRCRRRRSARGRRRRTCAARPGASSRR